MNKYTVIHTIRFSVQQAESLQKLKHYLTPPEWQYKTPEKVIHELKLKSAIGNPKYENKI